MVNFALKCSTLCNLSFGYGIKYKGLGDLYIFERDVALAYLALHFLSPPLHLAQILKDSQSSKIMSSQKVMKPSLLARFMNTFK
jgi:hypothetical protein